MTRTAFDVSLEVLSDGFVCAEALSEWMGRLQAQGLRYCPIAQEQITASCIPEEPEEGEVPDPEPDPIEEAIMPPPELMQSDGVPYEPRPVAFWEPEPTIDALPPEEGPMEAEARLDTAELEELPPEMLPPPLEEIIVPPEVEIITVHYELRSYAFEAPPRPEYDPRFLADTQRAGDLWYQLGARRIYIENSPPAVGASAWSPGGWRPFTTVQEY